MTEKRPKRPRDLNQWAKAMVDIATGQVTETPSQPPVESASPTMSDIARLGGLKGGRARADKLSAQERTEIAQRAAAARWRKNDD